MSLFLGINPMKLKQRPDITVAVDWEVKHRFKQTNKRTNITLKLERKYIRILNELRMEMRNKQQNEPSS